MSIFKRLSATVFSRIDQVVGEIENHDAVIQASLNDMRKHLAEAKVRLNQIQRAEERISQQIEEETNQLNLWQTRAIQSAQTDESKALACIQRGEQSKAHIERLVVQKQQYQSAAEKLTLDIEKCEQHLEEIKQKHQLMRARQSTTHAMRSINQHNNDCPDRLEDSFDRWEIKLSQSEMAVDSDFNTAPVDQLEQEFNSQEQQQKLRDELATLLASHNQEGKS